MKTSCCHYISRFKHLAACLILASSLATATAEDLFQITATSSTATKVVSGDNLIDLVENIVKAQDEFSDFQNTGFTADLKYAGVEKAIIFDISSTGTFAKLTIPSTGLEKTFTGSSRDDVENQMEDYFKESGVEEISKFQKAMAKQSLVAVTDGNPNASTATFSAQTFNQYAFAPGETRAQKEDPKSSSGGGFGFYADIGTFDADGIKGTAYTLPISAKFGLSERVGLGIDVPLSYIDVEGSTIFGGGLVLSLPIKVIARDLDQPLVWQLTPSGGALLSASYDMLAGGLESMVGGSSMLSYDFENFTLSMGNGLFWFEGIPVTAGDIEFDPGVSQQILKNGLKVSVPLYQNWLVEAYGIHTKFLEDAAIDQFYTAGGAVAWKPNPEKKRYWMLNLYSELAEKFTSFHASIGTTWKF